MAVLFLACFIAIPLVVISATEAQGVIYAVLAALAVAFVVAMWLLARRFRSREVVQYEVLAEPLELWRGDEVEAELIVYEPYRLAGRLEVGVVCVERYERPAPEGREHGHPPRARGPGGDQPHGPLELDPAAVAGTPRAGPAIDPAAHGSGRG